MEKEKRKRGIGEEAKNGFVSCFMTLLILISIPVGLLLLCVAVFIMDSDDKAEEAVAEIEPIVREVCNLPDYEADTSHYDNWDMMVYYDHLETEGIYIDCYPANGNWECSCTKAD